MHRYHVPSGVFFWILGIFLLLIIVVLTLSYEQQFLHMKNSFIQPLCTFNESTSRVSISNGLQFPPNTRFLLFSQHSGWSNQLKNLEHAIWIASKLNRVVILPPLLPHKGIGSASFKTYNRYSIDDVYRSQELYVRLDEILDFSTMPNISFIDYFDFVRLYPNVIPTPVSNYTHRNTLWIYKKTNLLGQKIVVRTKEYGKMYEYVQTCRDIAQEFQYMTDRVLAFGSLFKLNAFHKSTRQPELLLKYSTPIRTISRFILPDFGEYASIHVRGGDGDFKRKFEREKFIFKVLRNTKSIVTDYIQKNPNVSTIGIFVATDIKNILNHPHWVQGIQTFEDLKPLKVNVFTLADYPTILHALSQELGTNSAIFVDQQLAACASIGFSGVLGDIGAKSTFTEAIIRMRKQKACDSLR